jgi:signal transduction histidine kinase
MIIPNHEIDQLSADIRRIIDGEQVDIRDNHEGRWSILKNDIYTLADKLNEKAESLRRERESMADSMADISHQLKTPLTSVSIMAELLQDAPPEKVAEFAGNIRVALSRTDWLVSTLLKMAKIEAGTVDFAAEHVSSDLVVRDALKPLNVLLDVKDQQVVESGSVELVCDRRWTAEALTNLLKNASEHSPEGSAITVECGENPVCAWISVTDSGPGIPKTEIRSLFRRYATGPESSGFGVGLPLAMAILRAQNGDIEVESTAGHGATFTAKLYR